MPGREEETVELAEGVTVGDLLAGLVGANGQPSAKTAPLAGGAEVVLMRPIAGG